MKTLFFLLILFLLFSPHKAFAHSEVQIIEMTKEGFEPQSVTVDENVTIIFLNRDDNPRWPASNTHPSHDEYPEFDPKQQIQPGDSWTFKPKETGAWKYHDHLHPHMRGIIIITSEQDHHEATSTESNERTGLFFVIADYLAKMLNSIQQFFTPKNKFNPPSHKEFVRLSSDQQTEVINQIAEDDPENAWKFLVDAYKNEDGSSGSVHDLAHLTGSLMYKKLGFQGFSSCNYTFAFGCYHGFLDEAFAENLDRLLDAEKACLDLDENENLSGIVTSCIHGVGHGVASYYLTEDLEASLQTCKKLTKGSDYCFDGVFMEFSRNAPDSFFHKDDPLYPCNQLENNDSYAIACGRNQPSLLLDRFHTSVEETATMCESSESQPFRITCFAAIGSILSESGDVAQITSSCQSIPNSDFMISCIEAAAGNMVFQQIPGWSEKYKMVCEELPSEFEPGCLQFAEGIIRDYNLKVN